MRRSASRQAAQQRIASMDASEHIGIHTSPSIKYDRHTVTGPPPVWTSVMDSRAQNGVGAQGPATGEGILPEIAKAAVRRPPLSRLWEGMEADRRPQIDPPGPIH